MAVDVGRDGEVGITVWVAGTTCVGASGAELHAARSNETIVKRMIVYVICLPMTVFDIYLKN